MKEPKTQYGTINLTAYAPAFGIVVVINDFNGGNGTGRLDPGETADLVIGSTNNGNSQSVEAIGEILLNDPFITVNNYTHEFGAFNAGQSAPAMFNITVSSATPAGHIFAFDYSLEAGAYGAEKSFTTKVGLILEDFETGDFTHFDWVFSGQQPWQQRLTHAEGTYSAKSGPISHSQQTRMGLEYEVGTDDSISFFRRVSSESNYDYLRFYINGEAKGQWSGNVSWGKDFLS